MNRLSMRNVRRAFVVTGLASLAVLSGCATTAGSTPEQAVSQRAQERCDERRKLRSALWRWRQLDLCQSGISQV